MLFRKKGQMDELKKDEQNQVEDVVMELDESQLEGIVGGGEQQGSSREKNCELDDAYDHYAPMPGIRN